MKLDMEKLFPELRQQNIVCHCGHIIRRGNRNIPYVAVDILKHIQLDHRDNMILKWYKLEDCLRIAERGKF